MWIEIKHDVFESSDFTGLSYVFNILTWYPKKFPRYKVFVDLEKVNKTENFLKFQNSFPGFLELIEQNFNEFLISRLSFQKPLFQITHEKNKGSYNIEESIRYFSQPLYILLENNKNDAFFVKALFNHIDTDKKLQEFEENGWIVFENAGGCKNVANFMKGFLSSFIDLAARNNRETYDYLKLFILLDSDKNYMLQAIKSEYESLIDYLEGINLNEDNYHILEKRMMENYLPDEVFQELKATLALKSSERQNVQWIDAYLYLSDEQKDFINIDKGLNIQNSENLYKSLPQSTIEILARGFKYSNFKNSFPEFFISSPFVNRATLRNRANSDELDRIINKIKSLI